MKVQNPRPKEIQDALRLMGNPYASLSLFDDSSEMTVEPTLEQKRAYFKKLENPQAHSEIFGDDEDNLWQATKARNTDAVALRLEKELGEVLDQYKPYVARNQWSQLMEYRSVFLKKASDHPERAQIIFERLQKLRFSLAPGEKVEYNRAPAARIIDELEKILV